MVTKEQISKLIDICKSHVKNIDIDKIREMRLDKLLIAAKVEGYDTNERIKNYEKALGISDKRYAVIIRRDVDETRVNLYNPEWIKCWNGNMDIQPCLDYLVLSLM